MSRNEYERLTGLAKAAELPPLPAQDADGNYPAVEYARASLTRTIVRGRVATGLTQRQLVKRAGIRFEILCRLEKGRHTPSISTIQRIEQALKRSSRRA